MKIVAFALVAACSSSDKGTVSAAPDQASLSGNLTVSGAMSGTFHWMTDLAVTCRWVADTKAGEVAVTMTDDTRFITVRVTGDGTQTRTTLTSTALTGAPILESASGATITGTDLHHVSARLDTEAADKDGTKVTIKGTFAAVCR